MKYMVSDRIPCWYELSWRTSNDRPAIVFKLHEDFIRTRPPVKDDAPIVLGLKKELGLGEFHGSANGGSFGFEPLPMRRNASAGGFVEFLLPIPAIERPTGRKCRECHGKGEADGKECHWCKGDGKETKLSWTQANAAAASIAVFSAWTGYAEIETSASAPQLIEFHSYVCCGSSPLGGYYGIPFMEWLAKYPVHTEFKEASAAMRETYRFMFNDRREFMLWRTEARLLHPGYLTLDCPGDACGLHMSHHSNKPDEGSEFTCHNLDSPAQQLTLLAGLAGLHDQARQERAL